MQAKRPYLKQDLKLSFEESYPSLENYHKAPIDQRFYGLINRITGKVFLHPSWDDNNPTALPQTKPMHFFKGVNTKKPNNLIYTIGVGGGHHLFLYLLFEGTDIFLVSGNGALQEYDLAKFSERLQQQTIEFECMSYGIEYRVIDLNNTEKRSWIVWSDLPPDFPRHGDEILARKSECLPIILEETARLGYTTFPYALSSKFCLYLLQDKNQKVYYYHERNKKKYYLEDNGLFFKFPQEELFTSTLKKLVKYDNASLIQAILTITSKSGHTFSHRPTIDRLLPNDLGTDHVNHVQNWSGFGVTKKENGFIFTTASGLNPERFLDKSTQHKLTELFNQEINMRSQNKFISKL